MPGGLRPQKPLGLMVSSLAVYAQSLVRDTRKVASRAWAKDALPSLHTALGFYGHEVRRVEDDIVAHGSRGSASLLLRAYANRSTLLTQVVGAYRLGSVLGMDEALEMISDGGLESEVHLKISTFNWMPHVARRVERELGL